MAVVFATFSTWVTPTVAINRGEPWDSNDDVVKSHPDWFQAEPVDVRTSRPAVPGSALPWGAYEGDPTDPPLKHKQVTPPPESASAAPGEKRSVTVTKAD
jgi:hypothetical protein